MCWLFSLLLKAYLNLYWFGHQNPLRKPHKNTTTLANLSRLPRKFAEMRFLDPLSGWWWLMFASFCGGPTAKASLEAIRHPYQQEECPASSNNQQLSTVREIKHHSNHSPTPSTKDNNSKLQSHLGKDKLWTKTPKHLETSTPQPIPSLLPLPSDSPGAPRSPESPHRSASRSAHGSPPQLICLKALSHLSSLGGFGL